MAKVTLTVNYKKNDGTDLRQIVSAVKPTFSEARQDVIDKLTPFVNSAQTNAEEHKSALDLTSL